MPAATPPVFAALACLVLASLLALAHWRQWRTALAPLKLAASAAFLVVAITAGAMHSAYGQWVLLALALGAVGDGLLLSRRSALFLAGLGAFLLAHAVYAAAFAQRPQDMTWLVGGALAMAVLATAVLAWLWPRLRSVYRVAVPAYVAAIGAMVATALGTGAATGHWQIAAGALAFAASDIAVARERFVAASPLNKAWGLPLYYLGQVLLALSVAAVP
jgi:uncharacterized membrane protein YhhN